MKNKAYPLHNLYIISAVILSAIIIAACTKQTHPLPSNAVMKYETYGGFINPKYYRGVLILAPDKTTYTVYDSDGNMTTTLENPTDENTYREVLASFLDNKFFTFDPEYKSSSGIRMPDIGITNITFSVDNQSNSVVIIPYPGMNLPDGLTRIIDNISAVMANFANIQTEEKVLLEYTPMQCQEEPWNTWLANSSIRFIKAPTEQQVISMYYANQFNITVSDYARIELGGLQCQACDVCSKGYKIQIKVSQKDVDAMLALGWKE